MDSDEVQKVCTNAHRSITCRSSTLLPCPTLPGWSGLSGGACEGHGVVAVLVLRPEARAQPAEQRPAHHTQPALLPLPGDTFCTPTGGQTAGEMWPVSVVSELFCLRMSAAYLRLIKSAADDLMQHLPSIWCLQPAEPVLCEEPGRCAETGCVHSGLQQRRSGQGHPVKGPHCCH